MRLSVCLSVMMLPSRHIHVLRDINLILSVNVFKYNPLGVPVPKIRFFPKPEVNHKKVKLDVFALDIAFKLN